MRGLFGRRLFPHSNILAAISDAAATGTAHGAVGQDDLIASLTTNRDAKLLLIPRTCPPASTLNLASNFSIDLTASGRLNLLVC